MVSGIDELRGVELSGIEAAVGVRSFNRGRGYARGNRVVAIKWDPAAGTLTFDDGECTCPVGYNCKHVARRRERVLKRFKAGMVYRVIARDTIEEKVVALARRKAALFRSVMDEGDLFASSLTAEGVRELLV